MVRTVFAAFGDSYYTIHKALRRASRSMFLLSPLKKLDKTLIPVDLPLDVTH